MDKIWRWIACVILLLVCAIGASAAVEAVASFSVDGLRGAVRFLQESAESNVTIILEATGLDEDANGNYTLQITQFPADYTLNKYCSRSKLGKILYKLTDIGEVTLPTDGEVRLQTADISLLGNATVLGRALMLRGPSTVCANIHVPDDTSESGVEYSVYEARLRSPVAGSAFFRTYWLSGTPYTQVLADLAHIDNRQPADSQHGWAIMITDVLDTAADEARGTCNFLQLVYDPTGADEVNCTSDTPHSCKAGDLTQRLGQVKVSARRGRTSRQIWSSDSLQLPELGGYRSAYLVLYSEQYSDAILACAKLRPRATERLEALFSSDGVRGSVKMYQRSPFEPTRLQLNMSGLAGRAERFQVREIPVPPPSAGRRQRDGQNPCHRLGDVYNPHRIDGAGVEPAGGATHELYPVGDLSGKHGRLTGLDEFASSVTDFQLPLLGPRSVAGRSLAISSSNGTWICATLQRRGRVVLRAAAVFRYPVSGRVVFSQPADDPTADTTVHVEDLLYSDGAVNGTDWLRWYVRERVPGEDYRNWTARCVSAGDIYNPHQVNAKSRYYYGSCKSDDMSKCELGDLTQRLGTLSIVADRKVLNKTRRLWTDTNLPLSGPQSVIGRSLVIHDDDGPRARGDRLACVEIIRLFRYKAVVKEWAYSGEHGKVSGKLEFIQESPSSITNTLVKLEGLEQQAANFHVHLVPVLRHDTFPCHNLALGGHYNPYKINPTLSPPATEGSHDQYESGDLSGKYGTLAGLSYMDGSFNDSNLQLFGSDTILSRSVVIHKAGDNSRWACGTIGWGYSPSEARQVTAIASFHHPKGYAWGYIRFSQLVYKSGGRSETIIEMNLRHPGANDRNITRRHNWAVYVNPVGHDAAVKFFSARCTAAGYRWNPDFVHLANPNAHDFYGEQCSPDTPLRCEIGDLGGRLGPIDLGLERVVMSDPNLPLDGDFWHSATGKSIVIFEKDGGHNRFACANIEPDYDIIKRVSIRKLPKFVASQFIHSVREVMHAPEWYLFIDEQETTEINYGRCVQFTLHFRGPLAQKLQLDFNRLFAARRLDAPTVNIPGYYDPARRTSVPYQLCGALDPEDTRLYQNIQSSGGFYIPGLFSHGSSLVPGCTVYLTAVLLAVAGTWYR